MIQHQQGALEKIDKNTPDLRSRYPETTVPESILDSRRTAASVFGDNGSTIGGAEFAFDDAVINSKIYRRAMALAQAQISGRAEHAIENMAEQPDDQQSQELRADEDESTQQLQSSNSIDQLNSLVGEIVVAPGSQASPLEQSSGSTSRLWQAPTSLRAFISKSTYLYDSSGDWSTHADDWATAFNLKRNDIEAVPKNVLECQHIYWELLTTERLHIHQLSVLQRLYADQILEAWPRVVYDPAKFTKGVFGGIQDIINLHQQHLYLPLLDSWEAVGAWTRFHPNPFTALLSAGKGHFIAFCETYVDRQSALRKEAATNPKFNQFLARVEAHPWNCGLDTTVFSEHLIGDYNTTTSYSMR